MNTTVGVVPIAERDMEGPTSAADSAEWNALARRLERTGVWGDKSAGDGHLYVKTSCTVFQDVFCLMGVNVPEEHRRRGVASRIIDLCESLAIYKGFRGIFVGPYMTDLGEYLAAACEKRGYVPAAPFGSLKLFVP